MDAANEVHGHGTQTNEACLMKFTLWRRAPKAPVHETPLHTRAPEMMYCVTDSAVLDDVSVPELLETFVAGFEDQLTTEIARLAMEAAQTFVVEPIRLVFRGPARIRCWQRAWKIVSMHGVVLRVTVDVDEMHPGLVIGCVNTSTVAESVLGTQETKSSAHLSQRTAYFRERLLSNARAVMFGQALTVKRRADLVGHHGANSVGTKPHGVAQPL